MDASIYYHIPVCNIIYQPKLVINELTREEIMKIQEFLESPISALPKERRESDYLNYLENIFKAYTDGLQQIENTGLVADNILKNVYSCVKIATSILSSATRYFNGHPSDAYEELKKGVEEILPFALKLVAKSADKDYLRNLYRIRIKEDKAFDKKDMFHIPYELRHLVATQRYSIPGFPSLYLGSSIYIAWREMGCPDLNTTVITRVEAQDNVKVLDFAYVPQYEADFFSRLATMPRTSMGLIEEQFIARLICWPLIAACSIKVMNKKGSFKPEYIIPQILLQLLRNNVIGDDIDGIRYFSTNADYDMPSMKIHTNFVFPVKDAKATGHCDQLSDKFFLTEPASWQLLNSIYEEPNYLHTPDASVQLIRGINTRYRSTDFATIEARLIALDASKVN